LTRIPSSAEAIRLGALIVPRFSVVAIISVASLVLTGAYQSWLHAGSFDALIATDYGHALLVKLALIVPLLVLGAVNLLVFRPQLQAAAHANAEQTSLVPLARSVAAEVALALSVFVVVGVLTNLEPARSALLAQGVERSVVADGVRATLNIQPGLAGPNRFDVRLTSRDGRPITDAEKVALRFTMPAMNMGESELVAYPREDGHYVAQGGPIIMEGPWRIEAVIRRPGVEDVRPVFDLAVAPVSTGSTASAPPIGQSALVAGIELLIIGFAALAFAVWVAPRRRRLLPLAVPVGIVAILAGSMVAGSGAAAMSATVRNPIPPTTESIQLGREIYADRCAVCHGASGRGDGPAAVTLQPRPADFRVHLAAGHTDAQLFDWLSNGFPGTAMPAFKNELSVDERWHVLNYIKTSFGPGRS
jgi:copper transport protein